MATSASSGAVSDADSAKTAERAERASGRRASGSVALLAGALLLGLLLGGGSAYLAYRPGDALDPFGGQIRTSTYQAVILSNDKVYFGQLRSVSDEFYQLRRAFFLQEARQDEKSPPARAVVPLVREVHAPENSMLIRADEIVVIENLDEDSPVLSEIRRLNRDG